MKRPQSMWLDLESGQIVDGFEPNQFDPRLLGIQSINSFVSANSTSRLQMFGSHMTQTVVFNNTQPKRISTGQEYEFGKYTTNVIMPEDGRILKIIDRFPYYNDFMMNSERLIIYINNTGSIGCVSLPYYTSNHSYFGFQNIPTKNFSKLVPDATIRAGTVLMDSPNKTESGAYNYGRNFNVAYMTMPDTADDGLVITDRALAQMAFNTYEKRVITLDGVPLNLYGDDNNYKCFPDIGEYVHPKNEHAGLIFASREFDPDMIVIDQSVKALQQVDHTFDHCFYAAGKGGKLVDVKAYYRPKPRVLTNCEEMMAQPIRYANATRKFHQEIVDYYLTLRRQYGDKLRLTDEFHNLVVHSLAIVEFKTAAMKGNMQQQLRFKKAPISELRLEMVFQYTRIPTIGFKGTDHYGGKGVFVTVIPWQHAPMDINGKRADVIASGNATNNRMNDGRNYEHFVTASSDTCVNIIRNHLNIPSYVELSLPEAKRIVENAPAPVLETSFQYLRRFYEIVNVKQANWYDSLNAIDKREDLAYILNDGIYLHFPTNNPVELVDMANNLQAEYPPLNQPVRYTGYSGKEVTTLNPVMIGQLHLILLNKDATDGSAANTGQTNHMGILTHRSAADKYTTPSKQQNVRGAGESETRAFMNNADPQIAADMIERSTSMTHRREAAYQILTAPTPTNIYRLIDYDVIPRGTSRPLQLLRSVAETGGWWLQYKPFDPNQQESS